MSEQNQAVAQEVDADQLMTELVGVVNDLAHQVQDQQERLDEHAVALEQLLINPGPVEGAADGAVARPWSRGPRTREDWDTLAGWVDEMCAVHAVTALPGCWPAHEGLVCELAALREAWLAAQHHRSGSDVVSWYTYYWHPFIGRLDLVNRCRQRHQVDPVATVTDRGLLPDLPAV